MVLETDFTFAAPTRKEYFCDSRHFHLRASSSRPQILRTNPFSQRIRFDPECRAQKTCESPLRLARAMLLAAVTSSIPDKPCWTKPASAMRPEARHLLIWGLDRAGSRRVEGAGEPHRRSSGAEGAVQLPPGRVWLGKQRGIGVTSIPLAGVSTAILGEIPDLSWGRSGNRPKADGTRAGTALVMR